MKSKLVISLLLAFSALASNELNETQLLKAFFEQKEFKNKMDYITGEVLEYQKDTPHIGASLPKNCKFKYSMTDSSFGQTIWKVKINFENNEEDYYVKVEKGNDNPKISAIRAMFIPKMFEIMADSLLNSSSASKQEKYFAECIQMWYSGDDNLISFFRDKQDDFAKIFDLVIKESAWQKIMPSDSNGILHYNKIFREGNLKALLLNCRLNVLYKNPEYENIIFFNLGGFLDNEVGYFVTTKEGPIPRPFQNDYIHVEKMGANWYLYKTT